ncbi:deoxyribonuclease IV [[Mycoplasma] testudinis]|uniref:deoxyribonuclease IV n=1 Tax=[Mycoplasma] testudinis TaxID=33924 RepID=UPI000A613E07|nr:deoxyribonuclease IV [[Mycoplasma] testudinis]
MKKNELILGSHVMMKAPNYFLGSVQEALSYQANALMIYTGPPQNTIRKNINEMKITDAQKLWRENGCDLSSIIIHAPYIINLASVDEQKRAFGVDFFIKEVERTKALGAKYIVLHPGSAVNTTSQAAIEFLSQSLTTVIAKTQDVIICLETMAGKGNEIGRDFKQLHDIIEKTKNNQRLGICLDTCHIHDAGYDLSDVDKLVAQIDKEVGFERIKVVHFNDSLNFISAHKDRHANIGYGHIGFENLLNLLYHEKFLGLPVILETPYVDDKPPYAVEIEMLKKQKFTNPFAASDKKIKA